MAQRPVTADELERPLTPYGDAIRCVLETLSPLPPGITPLRGAAGLVLAEEVIAAIDLPGFDNAAMDGYAVRAADTTGASPARPAVLRISGDAPIGASPSSSLRAGTAVTIMTGAPVPPEADAVVPWEDTEPAPGSVAVRVPARYGANVRRRGESLRAGDRALEAGVTLDPAQIGLLASLGRTRVLAHPRPRAAVLSTGDELTAPGRPLRPGRVYDANAPWIASACEAAGAVVTWVARVEDDPAAIRARLEEAAAAADIVVTSGGVSVGRHDWVRDVLERDGRLDLWRVAMKPGKPFAFGRLGGRPVFGLPGNPGAAFAAFHAFVGRALRLLAGRAPEPRSTEAALVEAVPGSPTRTTLCPVRLCGDRAEPLPDRSSASLSALTGADGFGIVPPGGLRGGGAVRVEYLDRPWRA